jgi:hypothetical protein
MRPTGSIIQSSYSAKHRKTDILANRSPFSRISGHFLCHIRKLIDKRGDYADDNAVPPTPFLINSMNFQA